MAHFAKVVDGVVTKIIVVHDESYWDTFIDDSPGEYIQCSYNTRGGVHYDQSTNEPSEDQSKALRKNFPGPGYYYDSINNAFYPPQPFESWTLDEDTYNWNPPMELPQDGKDYVWNENTREWVEVI